MVRASGCRVWDDEGREYLDTVMALGAVTLGYGHPAIVSAVQRGARDGIVGPLGPRLEQEVAARLTAVIPGAEAVRFLKTGAEAVAAAIRLARVVTGRERVVSCGYHGWLDWCQDGPGVPQAVRALRTEIPFNDVEALQRATNEGDLAAIVLEPVIEQAPDPAWLAAAREIASRQSTVLIFDEIKTAFRIAVGGAAQRYGVVPDLVVLGKALGNGLPLAAVCGSRDVMEAATRTWISSTLATEYVSLAAAHAVLWTYDRHDVPARLAQVGSMFRDGLESLAREFPELITEVRGIPEMCYLTWCDEQTSAAVAQGATRRGLLFKRDAYNFVSLAHSEEIIEEILARLRISLDGVR
jgi:glutamate-1-semialdehyde 2,1-aminomutase